MARVLDRLQVVREDARIIHVALLGVPGVGALRVLRADEAAHLSEQQKKAARTEKTKQREQKKTVTQFWRTRIAA